MIQCADHNDRESIVTASGGPVAMEPKPGAAVTCHWFNPLPEGEPKR